jgi:hypothetical protein
MEYDMEKDNSVGRVLSSGRKLLSSIAQSSIYLSLAGDFGYPAALLQLIKTRPRLRAVIEEPSQNAAISSVVAWHEWGHPDGALKGWVKQADFYSGTVIRRSEFAVVGTQEITEHWACDITEVDGLFISKSDLTEFRDLDSFVEKRSPEYIRDVSLSGLCKNLAHGEVRILNENTSDYFAYHYWDGRVFLINSGGSHHFAAARYIAQRLDEPVLLQGKLYRHGINTHAIQALQSEFDIFVIGEADVFNLEFKEAMRHYKADYYYANLPRPYTDQQAIFLPRQKERSAKVAEILRAEGFFDLGRYLQDLSSRGASVPFNQ